MASGLNLMSTCFYTACVIYTPALALEQVTGLNLWVSIFSIGVVCMLYTSFGGMKAVIWTDVLQIFIMFGAVLIVTIKGYANIGVGEVWKRSVSGKRTQLFYWSSDPESRYTFWSSVIGTFVYFLFIIGCNQLIQQRQLANPTLLKARLNVFGSMIGCVVSTVLFIFMGLLLYAYFYDCDPLLSGDVSSRDQMFPLLSVDVLKFLPGLNGIYVAGMLSASLSTLSSVLNSLAIITLEDFIKPFKPDLSDQATMRLSKLLGIGFGSLCLALTVLVQKLGTVMQALLMIQGALGGCIAGLFTAGMILPWVNNIGAITGFFTAFAFTSWINMGILIYKPYNVMAPLNTHGCPANSTTGMSSPLPLNYTLIAPMYSTQRQSNDDIFPLYTINTIWMGCIAIAVMMTVSLIVSLLTGPNKPSHLKSGVIAPQVHEICTRLPLILRKFLGYEDSAKNKISIPFEGGIRRGRGVGNMTVKKGSTPWDRKY